MARVANLLALLLLHCCTSLPFEPFPSYVWDQIASALDQNSSDFFSSSPKNSKNNNHQVNLDPDFNDNQNDCQNECVPFYLCRNGKISTDGTGIIDIRLKNNLCSGMLDVCCSRESISPTPLPPLRPTPKGCGYRSPNGVGVKIVGDELNESQIGEFPWMLAVIPEKEMLKLIPRPKCGASLIHPRAAITAAHCVSIPAQRLIIRAGVWDISTEREPYSHHIQDVAVEAVIVHRGFNRKKLINDIAFLFLETSLKLTEYVNTICLPSQPQMQQDNRWRRCIATGWGKDNFYRSSRPHNILKKLELPLVPKLACQRSLRETRLGRSYQLHESFLCAGGERGRDTCSGDGGSPLVCPMEGVEGRYYQAGIVSWGIGCGDVGVPGVYVDVGMFRFWIDYQLEAHGLLDDMKVNEYS